MAARVQYSPDEVISHLNRSSLPTVITEGADDYIIFRRLEDSNYGSRISVLPVGGRTCVLKVFERREEILSNVAVAFIADRDLWVLTGTPAKYENDRLIFTDGYSIENDVIMDGNVRALLTIAESAVFAQELARVVHWYALAADRVIRGQPTSLDIFPGRILDDDVFESSATRLMPGETYPKALESKINSDPEKFLRGKTLMATYLRQIASNGRHAKHTAGSIFDHVSAHSGPRMNAIKDRVGKLIS